MDIPTRRVRFVLLCLLDLARMGSLRTALRPSQQWKETPMSSLRSARSRFRIRWRRRQFCC
jgi:hypothetical protein